MIKLHVMVLSTNLCQFAAREGELRRLRREVTQLEEENISLEIHVDKISTAVERLAEETNRQKEINLTLRRELTKIRQRLLKAFASVSLPGNSGIKTVQLILNQNNSRNQRCG